MHTASGNGTCPRGYYCPPQSAVPIVCEKGNVCGDNAMSQPELCPGGFYCPTTGMSAATPCPGGFFCGMLSGHHLQFETFGSRAAMLLPYSKK
jgi:hypothetical protein